MVEGAARAVLRGAVADPGVVARYAAKVVGVPGSGCLWWTGAVAGRGHGRFWVGAPGGSDVVVIAHRFAWALAFGADALDQVPVLGHRCDNPLCQRVGDGHVVASSAWLNRQEWVRRRHTIGGALRDVRGARGRAIALREAVRADPAGRALEASLTAGQGFDAAQLPLWDEPAVLRATRTGNELPTSWTQVRVPWRQGGVDAGLHLSGAGQCGVAAVTPSRMQDERLPHQG